MKIGLKSEEEYQILYWRHQNKATNWFRRKCKQQLHECPLDSVRYKHHKMDQMADIDMDDPLNITTPTVKEEITFKEEVLDESEVFIDPEPFSVPIVKVGVKRERDSSEETETATEGSLLGLKIMKQGTVLPQQGLTAGVGVSPLLHGETPTYGSEDDWMLQSIGRRSHPQRLRDPLEDVRVSYNELASQNVVQKISTGLRKDENPTKRLRSLEESPETDDGLSEGGESGPLDSGLPDSEEEILLEKEIEMKKKEIEMRKKALEVMHRKVNHGDISAEKQDEDSSVIELLKSDLHVATEELELLLQQRTFLFNGKKISNLELKLRNEEIKMREEEHQMKLKIYDIKKAFLFESSQMNGGLV